MTIKSGIVDIQHLLPVTKKANGRPKRGAEVQPCDVQELQVFWSCVMRGIITENGQVPAMKDRLRASELMAKSLQMFDTAAEEDETSTLSDAELEERIRKLQELA